MKRNFTILLLSAVLMMCCTVSALAQLGTPPDNEIWYTTTDEKMCRPANTDDFGTTIKSHKYENGLGVIAFDEAVTRIGDHAFWSNTSLQSISIPSGVTSIRADAFNNCTSLQSISFPSDSKLTSIGANAFIYCTSLQSISIPSGVTSIGEYTFVNCASLQSITFHSIPNVEEYAFFNLDNKNKTLDLTDSNKPYIGTSLANYPGGFTEANYHLTLAKDSWGTVVLPFVPSSESISNLEFYSYEGVDDGKVFVSEATDIQAGVPYLVKNVSEETTSFTLTATNPTITLTAGSKSADGFTFKVCFRSSDIAANSNFYYMNGTEFQKATQDNVAPLHAYIVAPEVFEKESMDVVIWNPGTAVFVDGVIPTATTTGKYGYWRDESQNKFWNKFCTKPITDDSKLTVPVAKDNEIWYTSTDNYLIENGVNSKTNEYLYGLGKIVLTDGVTEIANDAFNRNKALKSIFIPSAVKKIGNSSFWGCTNLNTVSISNGVTYIDEFAFGTIPIQAISIPSTVQTIAIGVFNECTQLQSIVFSSLPDVDNNAFGGCNKLATKVLDLKDGERPYIGTSLNNYPSGGFTEANYHLTLAKDSWGTVVLPFVPSSESISNLEFYSYEGVDDGKVFVSEATDIQAGVPYLVKNVSEETTSFTLTPENPTITNLTAGSTSADGFTFKGCFRSSDIDANSNFYYLGGTAFQKATQDNVAPLHAYIEAPETFEKVNMDVVIWNTETVLEFVDGVIPTATTTGRYGYWLDKSQNKFWTKFCARPITNDNELTVPVALNNEIWYTTTDNGQIEHKVDCKTNEYQYGLGKIVLADGVTEIAKDAFNRNKTIQSIFIPSAVKKIGNSSFWGCTNLNTVSISDGVTYIDEFAFGTIPIQAISIPSTVQTIAIGVFNECTQLQSIVFSSLPDVDNNAFGGCNKLATKVLDLKDGERPYIGTSLNNYPNGGFTEVRYRRTFEKNTWETVVLPFVPTQESITGLEFYVYNTVSNGIALVSKTTDIQAGTPYIVKNISDKTEFTFTATTPLDIVLNTSDIIANGFTMKGTFQSQKLNNTDSKKFYCQNSIKFKVVSGEQRIDPFRVYLETENISAAESLIISDSEHILAQDDNVMSLNSQNDSYYLDNVDLKYGHSYFCTDDFKATSGSYKLRVNPGKWNSWFVPFAVTTGTLEANNLTAAYIAGIRQYEKDAEGNITTQVDIIKIKNARLRAGTPYLVKYDGEDLGDGNILTLDLGETDFAASSDVHPGHTETMTASYDFIGCYEKAEFDISDKDMYYFIGSNGSLVHSKSNSFSALDWYLKVTPKGDVYDDLSTPSLAKSIIINVIGEEDETTGIRTLYPTEKQVKEVYDLSGRRLNAPKKGQINIINGKKILVK
ncbi:MAG: leucine-rich repeat domain-containing protein [Bacteroidaceae bacterium]|nr:leucine-rich repeat domain-containing protein [Bacteroidaceae bacterium]